jgi:hypothetical protein
MMRRAPAGFDPCTEAYVVRYFNRRDVQRALHANRTGLPYPYSPCRCARSLYSLVSTMLYPVPALLHCPPMSTILPGRSAVLLHTPALCCLLAPSN